MKVERSETSFSPVTITLGSQRELDAVYSVLQGSPYICQEEADLRGGLFKFGARDIRESLSRLGAPHV